MSLCHNTLNLSGRIITHHARLCTGMDQTVHQLELGAEQVELFVIILEQRLACGVPTVIELARRCETPLTRLLLLLLR